MAGLIAGCGTTPSAGPLSPDATPLGMATAPPDQYRIYIYREANYKGGGRIHQLQLDEKTLGPLTDANYYRVTLWPGQYHLNVYLPAESFLGQNHPPMSIGEPLRLDPRQAGSTLIYIYEDGAGLRHSAVSEATLTQLTTTRILAADLSARDTARLKTFMGTRYDGPEMFDSPHGRGTLTWPDGSRYVGIFDHGVPTPEGRFYYPDGTTYMGQIFQGRPSGAGVLMDSDGRVLFAGRFLEEKPHGEGLRVGKEGVELCVYDNGQDVTRAIKELTTESVSDQEAQLLAFIYGDEMENEAPDAGDQTQGSDALPEVSVETLPPSGAPADDAPSEEPAPAATEARITTTGAALAEEPTEDNSGQAPETLDRAQFEKMLEETRLRRRWALRAMIVEEQKARIAERRAWCAKELSFGRKWCTCAPFDPQAGQWQQCKR